MEEIHLCSSNEKLKFLGYGEWCEEPDEVYFTYKEGKCEVIRNIIIHNSEDGTVLIRGLGSLCGYICIPAPHPWYEKNEIDCIVHGGITYSESWEEEYWIGFDCAHSTDIIPSIQKLHSQMYKSDEGFRRIIDMKKEFRDMHPECALFKETYKNIQFCISECESLVDQAIEAIGKK